MLSLVRYTVILQCFDSVGWATQRASDLHKVLPQHFQKLTLGIDQPNSRKIGLVKQKTFVFTDGVNCYICFNKPIIFFSTKKFLLFIFNVFYVIIPIITYMHT